MIAPRVTDLNELVRGLDSMLRRLIGEDIVLETGCAPELWTARVDPAQFEQVILNLTVNARDAMPQGGSSASRPETGSWEDPIIARIPKSRPGAYVVLTVTDTGTGMDAATQARIFEPFFTTKEQGKGTGLGLAVATESSPRPAGISGCPASRGRGDLTVLLPRASGRPTRTRRRVPWGRHQVGSETLWLSRTRPVYGCSAVRVLVGSAATGAAGTDGAAALRSVRGTRGDSPADDGVVMPGMRGKELDRTADRTRPALRVRFSMFLGLYRRCRRPPRRAGGGKRLSSKPFDPGVGQDRCGRCWIADDSLRRQSPEAACQRGERLAIRSRTVVTRPSSGNGFCRKGADVEGDPRRKCRLTS